MFNKLESLKFNSDQDRFEFVFSTPEGLQGATYITRSLIGVHPHLVAENLYSMFRRLDNGS